MDFVHDTFSFMLIGFQWTRDRVVKRRKPNVTIFADASHDHRIGLAGWAAWIKADGVSSITYSGAIRSSVRTAGEAELCALANAVVVARLHGVFSPGDLVMLQSDCLNALTKIRNLIPETEDRPFNGGLTVPVSSKRRNRASVLERSAIAALSESMRISGILFVTRHVAGHRIGDGRQWVNSRVDVLARAAMRKHRIGSSSSPFRDKYSPLTYTSSETQAVARPEAVE